MRRSTALPTAASLLPSFAAVRIPLLWAALSLASTNAQMPYNPTRLLQSGTNVYVFRPSSSTPSQFELGSIDISSRIESSNLPVTTLYPTLPFLESDNQRPFSAVLDHGGNITVYTGDCASGASGAQVWSFVPEASEKSVNGSWKQEDITFAQDGKHNTVLGPNYLSAGMSFSALVEGDSLDTQAYFFGGMCPTQGGDSADWQANANYSNYMVTLDPSGITETSINYQLDSSTSRGSPIAEAGFTLTGLSPSFSNRSDGTKTQQQDFVLIGGHTSAAFINTSQVALFSLPQQGWTFVPVNQPGTSQTDLAVRADVGPIESRSGHSAVLAPDGQRLIMLGGWIGDVNTPAEPQLAILNVGDGYGGEGDWEWTVPSSSGSRLPTSTGIYGHGAVMLPGGVMMVMGGYSISASSSRRRRANANTQPMFFNVSSYTWTTDYSPPPETQSQQPVESGPLATTGQKAGLGVGLGIGMAAVLSLMAFYIFYTRKLKRQREFRESQLHELAMGAHRYTLSPNFDDGDGHGGYVKSSEDSCFFPSASGQSTPGWRRNKAQEAERTGLLVEIPSPTRGLRRNVSGRANHSIPRYDDRKIIGSGHIHPIDEEEEQEQDNTNDKTPLTSQPEMSERATDRGHSIFDNAPVLDPFVDQHRGPEDLALNSAPTSPVRDNANDRRDDPHTWQAVAGTHLPGRTSPTNHGRSSPTKSSERTGSNLSERSTYSNLSSQSGSGSLARSTSMRSAAILNHAANANPFKTPDASPTTDTANRGNHLWQTSTDPRTRSFTSIRSGGRPVTGNADTDSFTTARSSFKILQAEGEALLGGNPERTRPNTSTSNGSNSQSNHTEGSTNRVDTATTVTSPTEGFTRRRRMSFLGSVRRALARTTSSTDRTRSLTVATMGFESYTDDPEPEPSEKHPVSEHKKSMPASVLPRRAASDASFWRSKRGKQDWLEEEMDPNDPRAKWKRHPGDDWGAPEDLALAENERLRREWRERGNLLINLTDDDCLPTPTTPITPTQLGVPAFPETKRDRPRTPADEVEWDVEAAVERRVVQVMFTVPKSKLRVVNADVDNSSLLSSPKENSSKEDIANITAEGAGSPSRVRDLAGRFEQMSSPPSRSSPRMSPRPSPSPSIRSVKLRGKNSAASLATQRKGSAHSAAGKGKGRAAE
ncbi:hypothetical protein BU23DRAFT_551995 [Bimuria novae-zelandiae CBS 107.79]|uniref:Galactose oxidase n=1 Tax=Bimuria novae-zelandiae CBS 107.79 TaxID=1447943 RepID=A0A6A5VRV0_9PLEO|nr:hypothetical protein BU23DRAFT_551995 [Bimuria novae-zelandiae CBS 107.79]